MTSPQTIIDNLAPVLAEIAATAAQREQDREFSRDLAKQLSAGGFTKLRIPIEFGGLGFSLPEAFEVLVAVAAADSNIAQGLRPHFLAVESLLIAPDSEHRTKWLRKIAEEGVVIGNALTEVGNKPGELKTKIRKDGEAFVLSGTKFYSTGSLYADWIQVHAKDEEDQDVFAFVDRDASGVVLVDDWDGFGQKLTASGTTTFKDLEVDPRWIIPRTDAPTLVWTYLQLNLLTVLVGSAAAAVDEVVARAQSSTRNAWNPGVERRSDPVATIAIGDARSRVTVIRGALLDATRHVSNAATIATPDAFNEADAIVAALWPIVSEQALVVTSTVFDAVGASAVLGEHSIDRHWRNVRTVSSNNPVFLAKNAVGEYALNGTPVGTNIGKALSRPVSLSS